MEQDRMELSLFLLIQKVLILLGIAFILIGLLWPWFGMIPLGRLPGDIIVSKPGLKLYFPITTMVLVSLVVSVVLWILRK